MNTLNETFKNARVILSLIWIAPVRLQMIGLNSWMVLFPNINVPTTK